MFDQQDYYSEEQEEKPRARHTPNPNVLMPTSGNDFNHLTGEGESLIRMMKQRGLDLNEQEVRKLKVHHSPHKDTTKIKQKAGFFDGGASATFQQLLKALNKALSSADPQQASAILSHILEKKGLSEADRNKFGIMKCKILFGLAAYQDCQKKAQQLLAKVGQNRLVAATLSNYLSKCKAEQGLILEGYMDFLRSKAYLEAIRIEQAQKKEQTQFGDSQSDVLRRELDHTEMEYNIKMSKYRNSTNLVHPYFPQFRHRNVVQVACGDYHTLFLVGGPIGSTDTAYEVLGMGENGVGQILGRPSQNFIKQPVLIPQLSGKRIVGLAASKQSSLAWDQKGAIYEWGIKEKRNDQIEVTYDLGSPIQQLAKGYQHYAALTASKQFFTWGIISHKGANLSRQAQPYQQPIGNITHVSCGWHHTAAVDVYGDVFVMGSNEMGQLGFEAELHSKTFRRLTHPFLGPTRKVICINEATFFINKDEQVFFCGKISHNRQPIQKLRQGQFTGDIRFVINITGSIGNYYLTNQIGQLYHWEVDSSVKFKIQRQNQKIPQRIAAASHGNLYKIRGLIVPELTKVQRLTDDPRSYEDIDFEVQLFDRHGYFGNPNFVVAPRCQIFLSTYAIKGDDLDRENQLFLDSYQFSSDDSKVLLNEVVQSRLAGYCLEKDQERPWIYKLTINSEQSGKFYFYVLMEDKLVYSQQLAISISDREKELSEKNKRQKEIREEERRRKAEMERQRLLEEKLRKEAEEEERRKETQRRAEQAFKKHMREQEQLKQRVEDQRKAKKQLLTGGGFDLNKYKAKQEMQDRSSDIMQKTGQSFLPDINTRPSSKRKINFPSKKSMGLTSFDSVKGEKAFQDDPSPPTMNLFKSESVKEKQAKTLKPKAVQTMNKTGGTGKVLLKRGLSRGRK